MRNAMMVRRRWRKRRTWTSKHNRRAFEREVRPQCLLLAEAAKNPNSDEAQVMRVLDAVWVELCLEIDGMEAKGLCEI